MKKIKILYSAVAVAVICIAVIAKATDFNVKSLGFIAPTISGKGNVYGPQAGEIVYDTTDSTFYGYDHTSTWVPIGGGTAVMPTGSVLTFAGASCPTGYLPADGSAVSRSTFAGLFAVLGITHGQGDGSTTFNVPDYRGRFLRGADGSAGRDPDSSTRSSMNLGGNTGNTVGSVQGHEFYSHTHIQNAHNHIQDPHNHYQYGSYTTGGTNGLQSVGVGSTQTAGATGINTATNQPATATNQNSGGNETRPINAYVNFCIKH